MKKTTLFLAFCLLATLAFAQQKDDKQLFANFDKMLSEQFKTNETGATVSLMLDAAGNYTYKLVKN